VAGAQEKADAMIEHLASITEDRLIISFAPYTIALGLLKKVGELFPGPSKVRHDTGRLRSLPPWHPFTPEALCCGRRRCGGLMLGPSGGAAGWAK